MLTKRNAGKKWRQMKNNIYRWRRIPEDDALRRVHTDIVELLTGPSVYGEAVIRLSNGSTLVVRYDELIGPIDPTTNKENR